MLYQPIEGFNIIQLPPYRAPKCPQGSLSKTDQITFMTKFYPPPLFAKLILVEPQTSESSKTSSQKSFKDSQGSDIEAHSLEKSFSQQKDIKQYEVSQIKHPYKGFLKHSKKLSEMSLKDNENEESEFQYRQLLLDLSFQQKNDNSASFEQKNKGKRFYFEFSERDHSQNSLNNIDKDQRFNKEKENLQRHKTQNDFKWDPESEILFCKQNRITRMVIVLKKKCLQIQKSIVQDLKKVEKVPKTVYSKEKSLQRFLWNKKRKQNSKIFKSQLVETKGHEILHK